MIVITEEFFYQRYLSKLQMNNLHGVCSKLDLNHMFCGVVHLLSLMTVT